MNDAEGVIYLRGWCIKLFEIMNKMLTKDSHLIPHFFS